MDKDMNLRIYQGATAIVTGGASGIGRALARELARRGAEVFLADLQIEQAEEVAADIRNRGGKAVAENLDVTDYKAVEKVVRDAFLRTGRLDYLFNNAGIFISGGIHQYSIDDWDYILNINVRGVIHGIHAAYPIMVAQGFGHIVNTSSMAGLMTSPGEVAYSMTKHAVFGLSRSLRAQAGLLGVRVSVLCPGIIQDGHGGKRRDIREVLHGDFSRDAQGTAGENQTHAGGPLCRKSSGCDCPKQSDHYRASLVEMALANESPFPHIFDHPDAKIL